MPTTRIRDLDVYHESHGAGETVLLIHGLGSSTEDWEPQVKALYQSVQEEAIPARFLDLLEKLDAAEQQSALQGRE